jgi:hypothetical protein
MLADLKARRGRFAEANALYEQAEDVIEGMLISVDEPYWNSSVAAAMSETYLRHFELVTKNGDAPGAFAVLERVRGRTLAWALKDRKAFPTESDQTAALEGDVAGLQARLMQTNAHLNANNCWTTSLNTSDGLVWRGPEKMFPTTTSGAASGVDECGKRPASR